MTAVANPSKQLLNCVVVIMTQHRNRQSAKAIEHTFPHFVEMVAPEGGFGGKLGAMYNFHVWHGISAQRGHGQRLKDGRSVIRWCFADPGVADAFAQEFRDFVRQK